MVRRSTKAVNSESMIYQLVLMAYLPIWGTLRPWCYEEVCPGRKVFFGSKDGIMEVVRPDGYP